jgi:hypothetical protein
VPRLRLQVVVAVRQPEAAGRDVSDDARRVVVVGPGAQAERHLDADLVEACDHPLDAGARPRAVNLREERRDGLRAEAVGPRLVHARAVEVSGQLFDAAPAVVLRGRDSFEYLSEFLFSSFASGPAPAPARHGGRDGVRRAPAAVGELEEVVARGDAAVEVRDLYPAVLGQHGRRKDQGDEQNSQERHKALLLLSAATAHRAMSCD